MTFWKHIEPSDLELKLNGVGTYVFTIRKPVINEIWPYLDDSKTIYPTWGELIDRFPQPMGEYERLLQKNNYKVREPKSQ